ncbi:hypothetical protein V6Z93_002774 [Aspergillus fumigatus]
MLKESKENVGLHCNCAAGTELSRIVNQQPGKRRQDCQAKISRNVSRDLLGFRRIGSSAWFGLSLDENHHSCHLTCADELPALPFRGLDSCLQSDLLKSSQATTTELLKQRNNEGETPWMRF